MRIQKINAAICMLASLVLSACGGGSSSKATNNVINNAPNALMGSTYSACDSDVSTSQTITYSFSSNTAGTLTTTDFPADTSCSTGGNAPVTIAFTYVLGDQVTTNSSQIANKFDITVTGSATLFSLLHLSGTIGIENMQLGSTAYSSNPSLDGSSDANRHDGLDILTFTLQP